MIIEASLLEAEVPPQYYAKVARVIDNRLNQCPPWDLGLDSTVAYAVNKYIYNLTQSDLNVELAVQHDQAPGLPPGPIDSPDAAAIQAVLHPAHGDWLYFVTVNKQGHDAVHEQSSAVPRSGRTRQRTTASDPVASGPGLVRGSDQVTRAAVLGSPIAHSLSPVLHRAAYRELGLTGWRYDAIECDEQGLARLLRSLGPDWAGLSLTMPLKRAVLPLLDQAEQLALEVGAANTVLFAGRQRRRVTTPTSPAW